jgi:hypothetical protein
MTDAENVPDLVNHDRLYAPFPAPRTLKAPGFGFTVIGAAEFVGAILSRLDVGIDNLAKAIDHRIAVIVADKRHRQTTPGACTFDDLVKGDRRLAVAELLLIRAG